MAVKTDWTAGEVLTASQTSTYLANAGLDYVTQVTVGEDVTYMSVPSAFSSTWDNYVISCSQITAVSNTTTLSLQFEDSGGTPNTSFYSAVGMSMTWGSTTVTGIAETSWPVLSRSSAHNFSGVFDVLAPNLSGYSWMTSVSPGGTVAKFIQGLHTASSSWTRFRLSVDAGTISGGTITVYGRRKA
jgi:hypothetical protein